MKHNTEAELMQLCARNKDGSYSTQAARRDAVLRPLGAAVREAVALARTGDVVTIGIRPTHPSTGFGYIKAGKPLDVDGAPSARDVEQFVEKPDSTAPLPDDPNAFLADRKSVV